MKYFGFYQTSIDDLTDAQNDSTNSNLFIGTAGFSGTFYNNNNTAIGINALATKNTDNSQTFLGDNNTANGKDALRYNTTGRENTANGVSALFANTTGFNNTASGSDVLRSNTTGHSNTANGSNALVANTTGFNNTASGRDVLRSNTTGYYNTAKGWSAGRYIADGATGLTIANYSIFVGASTKALNDNSNNEIVIGYNAIGHGNNTATIGNTANTATYFSGKLNIANIPTSPVGLSSGDVYSNAGILTIVS